jgi:hypothetical protein
LKMAPDFMEERFSVTSIRLCAMTCLMRRLTLSSSGSLARTKKARRCLTVNRRQ